MKFTSYMKDNLLTLVAGHLALLVLIVFLLLTGSTKDVVWIVGSGIICY